MEMMKPGKLDVMELVSVIWQRKHDQEGRKSLMSETITLMKSHRVRRFKEEVHPSRRFKYHFVCRTNGFFLEKFQSYSVIVNRSQEKKDASFELVPQKDS